VAVSKPETTMYRIVQTVSEPKMPIGMSFCGFFASCAAVETASNPIYAKNTTLAPRNTPDQPKEPNDPVFGGRKSCQLACDSAGCFSKKGRATAINVKTAINFTKTIPVLNFADSLIPMIRISVTAMIAKKATRLNLAVACGRSLSWSIGAFMEVSGDHRPWNCTQTAPGTSQICGGRLIP